MSIEDYFDYIGKKLEDMTDEEFMKLLNESGLEKCPFENNKESQSY